MLTAIDGALLTHELIKVRVTGNDEVSASHLSAEVEKRTRSSVAQVIGKTLVLYRARKKDPVIVLPKLGSKTEKAAKRATAKASKPAKASK